MEMLIKHGISSVATLWKPPRKKGVNIIWKSFPNHPHDVPPDSLKLARAFLAYYHELNRDDLIGFGNYNNDFENDDIPF